MGLRERLERSKGLVVAASVAMLLVAGAVTWWAHGRQPDNAVPTKAWFYDIETMTPFVADYLAVAPIMAPSKQPGADKLGTGMRARYFACGGCSDQNRRLGYLERLTPEGKAVRDQMRAGGTGPGQNPQRLALQAAETRLVSASEPVEWVSESSPEGAAIMGKAKQCPDSRMAIECFPQE